MAKSNRDKNGQWKKQPVSGGEEAEREAGTSPDEMKVVPSDDDEDDDEDGASTEGQVWTGARVSTNMGS